MFLPEAFVELSTLGQLYSLRLKVGIGKRFMACPYSGGKIQHDVKCENYVDSVSMKDTQSKPKEQRIEPRTNLPDVSINSASKARWLQAKRTSIAPFLVADEKYKVFSFTVLSKHKHASGK